MELILEVLKSVGVGLVGILFFTLWRSRKFILGKQKFKFKLILKENLGAWLWSLSIILLTAIIVIAIPSAAKGITGLTGLEVADNPASFFTFGLGLSGLNKKKRAEGDREANGL